jgi:8-oxo-dGTP pyrophosphatase MutT (NUDIX family)
MIPELQVTQSAAIPFRKRNGEVEYCLITSSSQPTLWTIPKGTIEPGDTAAITALKEAEEEAGLQGRVVGECQGTFTYRKNGQLLNVAVFLMQVDKVLDRWDESHIRKRQWVSEPEAVSILAQHPVLPILQVTQPMTRSNV